VGRRVAVLRGPKEAAGPEERKAHPSFISQKERREGTTFERADAGGEKRLIGKRRGERIRELARIGSAIGEE